MPKAEEEIYRESSATMYWTGKLHTYKVQWIIKTSEMIRDNPPHSRVPRVQLGISQSSEKYMYLFFKNSLTEFGQIHNVFVVFLKVTYINIKSVALFM